MGTSKISKNYTIDIEITEIVKKLSKTKKENRSVSNMIEVLVTEALGARGIKLPK